MEELLIKRLEDYKNRAERLKQSGATDKMVVSINDMVALIDYYAVEKDKEDKNAVQHCN